MVFIFVSITIHAIDIYYISNKLLDKDHDSIRGYEFIQILYVVNITAGLWFCLYTFA